MAKQQALVAKKVEWFPIDHPQNKWYTDRLLWILEKRVKKDPLLFVLYSNGRIVWIGQSDQGIAKLKSQAMENKKKKWWDRFAIYTIAKRAYLNDAEALATRIAMDQKIGYKNFARAKNTTEDVKKDVRQWANAEMRNINRSLRPLEKKYKRALTKLDTKESRLRKRYLKRIEKAKDAKRQGMLRMERDKKIEQLRMQRKKLAPWRESISDWQAKMRSFMSVKM